MKQTLVIALALTVVASNAFASRARLEALGENKNGSLYIQDDRNMFYNPANIVNSKKKVFFEFGGNNASTDSTATTAQAVAGGQTQAGNNKPQGGIVNTFGDYSYGLYLNNESDATAQLFGAAAAATSTSLGLGAGSYLLPDSTIEAFFAGSASDIKWGGSVFYADNMSRAAGSVTQTANQLGARAGVIGDKWQGFATVAIMTKGKGNATAGTDGELKGTLGLDVGGSYNVMEDLTTFARFRTSGVESSGQTNNGGKITGQNIDIGFGWKKPVKKDFTVFARSGFSMSSFKRELSAKGTQAASENKLSAWNVPVVIGAEANALSWLDLRGSITQSLLGQTINGVANGTFADSTSVAAGLTLKFGDVAIDGLVATNGGATDSTASGTPGNSGSNVGTGNNFGFGDNMITRIAMTYSF